VLAQNPDERAPNRSITAGEDITEAIDFLSTRPKILFRRLTVNNADAQIDGFVFAARESIITLRLRGYLNLFDRTYAPNALTLPMTITILCSLSWFGMSMGFLSFAPMQLFKAKGDLI
jgi:hypothetical protein